MCIDHRKLNQKLVKDKFPLPIIEDVLVVTLQEAEVYSTLDLRNGFSFHASMLTKIAESMHPYIVPDGQFEFNKSSFRTKHKSGSFPTLRIKRLSAKKELITRIARWALQLEEFDYELEHRAGSRTKHVDALSRYPVMMVCNYTLTSQSLKTHKKEDDNIQTLKSLLEKQESEEFLSEMVYSTST
ncbi:transposon Ty3-I Gag-Pol polyprotein [Trichonephila clavipes]|nr:transposon Ty3-I Gag-Pol polyprotein [Trichonephila clavipes]